MPLVADLLCLFSPAMLCFEHVQKSLFVANKVIVTHTPPPPSKITYSSLSLYIIRKLSQSQRRGSADLVVI